MKDVAGPALGAFAAALALLGAFAPVPGGAPALAEAPGNEAAAATVVGGFDPALPDTAGPRPASTEIGPVAVSAHVEVVEAARRIVVEFENAGSRPATVACRVGLARLSTGPVSPLARIVPPPAREELLSSALRVGLGPGERERRELAIPAGLDLATSTPAPRPAAANESDLFAERPARSWTALSIEALDGAR